MPSASLRNRAILAAVPVLAFALGLVGMAVDAANERVAVAALRDRMETTVYAVLAAMEVADDGAFTVAGDFADPRLLQPGSGLYVEVQGARDRWRSPSSLGRAWPELDAVMAGQTVFAEPPGTGGHYVFRYGIGWQREDGAIEPFTVSVLVDAAEIARQTSAFRQGLWLSLLLAAGILVFAQGVILLWVFRPLRRVAQDVERIESGQAERLADDYPRELEPLARNVNRLLATEKSNQERIRNALDSLAHSLKTPLAVIRANLSRDGAASGDSVQDAVDEMQHLVATRLERAGRSARRTLAAPVAVRGPVLRVVRSLHKVHSQKMIEADVTLDESLRFYGEERDLLELAGNLLDNAFKYGRSRVRVGGRAIRSKSARPGLELVIEDDGPGIDADQRERLLQRGVRGDERVEGHGLGLAIVRELVDAYGGALDIRESDLGGARVAVTIPPG
ncbi:MAG: ATP-binding protein [Xanthomonadales bacterium]